MRVARSVWVAVAIAAVAGIAVWRHAVDSQPHNVILFVADGLRSQIVTRQTAPDLQAVRDEGVDFQNSHSVYPTVTTANASAMATGHYLGDTGNFGNYLYTGPKPVPPGSINGVTPSLEEDNDLTFVNGLFGGNYLTEASLLAQARAQGYQTALIGKKGPTSVHDMTVRDGSAIIIDDATGGPKDDGIPLAADLTAAIKAAGLPTIAPDRGLNGGAGAYNMPGAKVANVEQQDWFTKVATEVLLPRFKKAHKPFAMVFWSRDPDGTQHYQGDSLNTLTPGINGPTAMAGIRNASNDLGKLRAALKALGLDKTTDVVVTADHGFATISKQSKTSASARLTYSDTVPGFLPTGFLAADLGLALKQPVWATNGLPVALNEGFHPPKNGALIGPDPANPLMVVAVNGGSDLIYLTGPDRKALMKQVTDFLMTQDYTAAIFVNDAFGTIPGTLPMSAVNLMGEAKTPHPSIVVSFRTETSGCDKPETCVVLVADSELQQGQGGHGSLSRAETHNFMAAVGPDFKNGYIDPSPVSNADLAWTIAKALKLDFKAKGKLTGRVATEALNGGPDAARNVAYVMRSEKAANGFQTILNYQQADGRRYFDAAGMPGRVFGLKP